jgi:hypothetical protein
MFAPLCPDNAGTRRRILVSAARFEGVFGHRTHPEGAFSRGVFSLEGCSGLLSLAQPLMHYYTRPLESLSRTVSFGKDIEVYSLKNLAFSLASLSEFSI